MCPLRARLRLGSKMLAGFCALTVLTAVLGGYALLALDRTNQSRQAVSADDFGDAYLIAHYVEQAWNLRTAAIEYMDAETPAQRATARATIARPPARKECCVTKRVLIIDDEDDIREVAQVSLELVGGWQVLTARSGQEGIQRARADQPDAILLDVMMPDLDGPTTFEHLQADPTTRDIPVLLLTAKIQTADRARFDSLGVQGVLPKPFDPLRLAADIAAALGWAA